MHKVLPFSLYNPAPRGDSAHEINVVKANDPETVIANNISLEELYEKHIKPGNLLYLKDEIPKKKAENPSALKTENIPLKHRTFAILEAMSISWNVKDPDKGKGRGALRLTPISLSSSPEYFKLAIDRSYQFIEHGSPVEFKIRIKGKKGKEDKADKLKPSKDQETFPWIHEHFPHLRPDFILKSMPEGSMYMVDPVSDGRVLQFVIIKPSKITRDPKNYTRRLFRVKQSVETSIDKGIQGELPKVMRQKLYDAGNKRYSKMTGEPGRYTSEEPEGDEAEELEGANAFKKWTHVKGGEKQDGASSGLLLAEPRLPPSADRYLPEKVRTGRTDKLNIRGERMGYSKPRPIDPEKAALRGHLKYGRGNNRGRVL